VTDDPVDDRMLGQEGYDLHPPAATGTDHRVHLVDPRTWLLKSSLDESFLFSRLKLCPNLKISNSIEIQNAGKTVVAHGILFIFYTLAFSAASYTR
jgi:hypothetical protein